MILKFSGGEIQSLVLGYAQLLFKIKSCDILKAVFLFSVIIMLSSAVKWKS